MGEPWHNWFSDMELQDDVLLNQCHKIESLVDGDHQIFREIMHHHQPTNFSSDESHSPSPTDQNNSITNNIMNINNNNTSNFIFSSPSQCAPQKPATAISPTSFIFSFGDSTIVAATRHCEKQPFCPPSPSIGVAGKHELLQPSVSQTMTKKGRSSSETLDHIMAERKRRRELTERFIALSATIPGLKKIDKSTILGEAVTHVKRLQERVRELEEQNKRRCVESVSFVRKSNLQAPKINEKGTTNSDDDDFYRTTEALPTVEARVFKKDVLLRIHCKIQNGILRKILAHLKNLDLSTVSNSVTPFGNSTLDISIIVQMGDKFKVTINDLVNNLRLALLESCEVEK